MASYNLHDHRGNIQKVFHGLTLELASIYQGNQAKHLSAIQCPRQDPKQKIPQ